jgi:N-acetyltransferase
LRGKYATLAPLSQRYHDGVVAAAKDGELWRLWYTSVQAPEKMAAAQFVDLGAAAW